jgi:nucleoid DNA-binding protein
VTKADIVDKIASATGLTKVETEAVVDGFIMTVISTMKEGKNIEIRGFGSFKLRNEKAGWRAIRAQVRRLWWMSILYRHLKYRKK